MDIFVLRNIGLWDLGFVVCSKVDRDLEDGGVSILTARSAISPTSRRDLQYDTSSKCVLCWFPHSVL